MNIFGMFVCAVLQKLETSSGAIATGVDYIITATDEYMY
jgi:hypothetical protein